MGWMLLLLLLMGGGLVGFFVGERSYPSHDDMREAAGSRWNRADPMDGQRASWLGTV
jgi:hypothetical protein